MPLIDEVLHRQTGEERPVIMSSPVVSADTDTTMTSESFVGHTEAQYESYVLVRCRYWADPKSYEEYRRYAVRALLRKIYDPLPRLMNELRLRLGPVDEQTRALLDEIESIINP